MASWNLRRLWRVALIAATILVPGLGSSEDELEVLFVVEAPAGTTDASLHLVGDHPKLGAWKVEAGLRLERGRDGRYRGRVSLPLGARVEFKLTRGSWSQVEKTAGGGERSNRVLVVDKGGEESIQVARWADGAAPRGPREGLSLLGTFGEKSTGIAREVWVHPPPGYDPKKRYPVLYMLDGQNLFEPARSAFGQVWAADVAADELTKRKEIEPIIIVGIDNSPRRMAEYTPDKDKRFPQGGELEKTEAMIRDEVEPALVKAWSVRLGTSSRAICGSSLGGLSAFHLALRYPTRYGLVAAVSPSLWWNDGATEKLLEGRASVTPVKRLWIDMGTAEGEGGEPLRRCRNLVALLRARGYGDENLHLEVIEGGQHNEKDWQRRMPQILRYLFKRR